MCYLMRLSQLQQDFTEIPKSIDPTDTPVNVDATTSISIQFVKKSSFMELAHFRLPFMFILLMAEQWPWSILKYGNN